MGILNSPEVEQVSYLHNFDLFKNCVLQPINRSPINKKTLYLIKLQDVIVLSEIKCKDLFC